MNQKKPDASRGSARDALVNLFSSLQKIFERQNSHRPDSQQDAPESESVTEIRARMRCGICNQPVEPGNFLLPLTCCGAVAHVPCMAKTQTPIETLPCPALPCPAPTVAPGSGQTMYRSARRFQSRSPHCPS
jgi:hypothetical protein